MFNHYFNISFMNINLIYFFNKTIFNAQVLEFGSFFFILKKKKRHKHWDPQNMKSKNTCLP